MVITAYFMKNFEKTDKLQINSISTRLVLLFTISSKIRCGIENQFLSSSYIFNVNIIIIRWYLANIHVC